MKQLNWYQIFGKSNIPDGRTVLPTDDIQIWLHCANIWNKTYTTLAEVLADTTTLLALINSPNAVDYMVRSTTWAVSVSVPVMTSNTTPSGECFASSVNTTYYAWKAFDNDNSTVWAPSTANLPQYIGYKFTSAVKIDSVRIYPYVYTSTPSVATFQVQGSNDNATWIDIDSVKTIPSDNSGLIEFPLESSESYLYYRAKILTKNVSGGCNIVSLNFYSHSITDNVTAMSYIGLNNYCANTLLADSTWKAAIYQSEYKGSVLNITVPKMTSNTAPSGTCGGTSISSSGNDYWKAFNSSEALGWQPSGSDTFGVAKVYYHFTSRNLPCYARLKWIRNGATYSMTVKVIGSNDGATWTEISPATVLYNNVDTDQILNAITGYEYVGMVVTYSEISITAGDGFKCQFYGREDV